MDRVKIYNLFKQNIKKGIVLMDELMNKHTYFKIGGPVDVMVLPGNIDEISLSIKLCRENNIDHYVIGNGTNLLVSDKGIRGVVIKIENNLSNIEINGTKIIAQAGALLSTVSKRALKHFLTGLEFASGIPGTVGGAVAMNAGAYGPEMKDVITKVKCIDQRGELREYSNEEMEFGYRNSIVQREKLIVVEAEMELVKGDYDKIKGYMDELTEKRRTRQPLHLPSAGSTFKRPQGDFAGRLIDAAGLRGLRYGDAQVSEKHCGFIVNLGNATSEDVLNLIKVVQKTVKDKFGVELETEVKVIGEM